jgi:hypothetical protein
MSLEIWKDGDTVNVRDVDGLVQLIENGGGGDALTTNPLSQFAATTSSQLAGVISDETGSGALVFATSPTLVTPILGTPTSGNLANCAGYAYGSLTGVPSTFTPASHTHGNITNEGTIGSTADLLLGTGTAGAIETRTASDVRTLLGLATTDSPTFAGLTVADRITTATNQVQLFPSATASERITFSKDGLFSYVDASQFQANTTGGAFGWAANNRLLGPNGLQIISTDSLRWTSNTTFGTADLFLHRDAANTLAQRNGTAGQVARWYKTFTSATNAEWLELDAAGNASNFDIAACIGSAGGTARGIRIGGKNAAGTFTPWLSFDANSNADFLQTVRANRNEVYESTSSRTGTDFSRLQTTFTGNRFEIGNAYGATASAITGRPFRIFQTNTASRTSECFVEFNRQTAPFITFGFDGTGFGSLFGLISMQGTMQGSSGTQTGFGVCPTINQSGSGGYSVLIVNPTVTATGSGVKRLIDARVSNAERFAVADTGAISSASDLTFTPSSSRTLSVNGEFSIEMTSNTSGNLVYRGSDGTTRRMALTFV